MQIAARATRFAHLVGLGRTASAAPQAEADDESEARRAEEEAAAARAAEDEEICPRSEGEADDDYAKRLAAAKEEDAKGEDESEDEHDKRVKENRAKRKEAAKKAKKKAADDGAEDEDDEGDDEDDREEMKDKHEARAPRLRERARCAAIFADSAAAANPALAAQLAFGTSLPRSEAVSVLRAGGSAPRTLGLAGRMATAAIPNLGVDAPAGNAKTSWRAAADHVVDLYEQARGLKR